MKKKRILLSVGGTGGHLFPAQALAEELASTYDILFVGGKLGTSPYFDKERFPFEEVVCTTFSFSKPWQVAWRAPKLLEGLRQSRSLLKRYHPDLVIGFGSFYSLPCLLAAKMSGIPLVLHEQNTVPGKVNRLFSRFSLVNATTFPQTDRLLRGKIEQVAFPHRFSVSSQKEGYPLDPTRPTLLVFGGSQGGAGLNRLLCRCAPSLREKIPEVQLLHFTGRHGDPEVMRKAYEAAGIIHHVQEFESDMAKAWSWGDVALTRAGAATVMELIATETPALLIPFPRAADNHQYYNASFFSDTVGGGQLLLEENLCLEKLVERLVDLFAQKEQYREQIHAYKKTHTPEPFPKLIHSLLERS